MTIFFTVVAGIILTLFGMFLMFWTMESFISSGSSWLSRIVLLCLTICFWAAIITGVVYLSKQEEKKGPCVEYKTRLMFNAATKTMMPVRICTKRGEWANE